MRKFERDYAILIEEILEHGVDKDCRNGMTRGLFGKSLVIDDIENHFPIIQGRQMFTKGVLGEFAALVRQPKCVEDFEKWGCNYWKLWAEEDGSLNVDYGNEWFKHGQIEHLKECLRNNPNDRRMVINSWRPENLKDLSLPCCHYNYQFYVAEGTLSMIWTQRSVDMLIGLPSDIILAATWLITLANEFGYKVGEIKMDLGDCHVYHEHLDGALQYVANVRLNHLGLHPKNWRYPTYYLASSEGTPFEQFEPKDLIISLHPNMGKLDFELKA